MEAVPASKNTHPAVAQVTAQMALSANEGEGAAALAEAEAKAAANPGDPQARLDLAEAQASGGQPEAAVDTLLGMIEADREWNEEAARKKLLMVFDALGPTHPAAKSGRRRLSSLLFA